MSFKVTDFGSNRKLMYDFLLVINTNSPPIMHRFRDIVITSSRDHDVNGTLFHRSWAREHEFTTWIERSISAVPVPRLCKKYTISERQCLCSSGYALKCIVPILFENYARCEWACLHRSGYVVEYKVPRLCQKYTCSEWAWLYASGYSLKCIAPLFPIGIRNLHSSPGLYRVFTYGTGLEFGVWIFW